MRMFLILGLFLFTSIGFAKNHCWCTPTTGKDYIGEARQRNWFGFTIHWICDYDCNSANGAKKLVKGTYKKFYAKKTENGLEGICEGMKYEPHYSMRLNDYVYMWDGKVKNINPARSDAKELNQWAKDSQCE